MQALFKVFQDYRNNGFDIIYSWYIFNYYSSICQITNSCEYVFYPCSLRFVYYILMFCYIIKMHQLIIRINCKIIITSTSRWTLPDVRLLQPLDISHWILLQLHSPWQFLPYEGCGHLEEQFNPVYPGVHSINPSKSKYYVNIFILRVKMFTICSLVLQG